MVKITIKKNGHVYTLELLDNNKSHALPSELAWQYILIIGNKFILEI